MTALDDMLTAYAECAMWSESIGDDFAAQWAKDHPGEEFAPDVSLESFGFTRDDIAPEALDAMRADCADFLHHADPRALAHWEAELGSTQVGHDFWLTRNHHGAGFWDRFMSELGASYGRHLTEKSEPYGESNLYVGDDGRLYVS